MWKDRRFFFIFYPLSLFDIKKSSPLTRHPRQRVCSNEDYQEVAKARQASPCHELCGTKPTFQNHYCLPHLPPPKNIAKVYGNGKTKRYFFRVAPIGFIAHEVIMVWWNDTVIEGKMGEIDDRWKEENSMNKIKRSYG